MFHILAVVSLWPALLPQVRQMDKGSTLVLVLAIPRRTPAWQRSISCSAAQLRQSQHYQSMPIFGQTQSRTRVQYTFKWACMLLKMHFPHKIFYATTSQNAHRIMNEADVDPKMAYPRPARPKMAQNGQNGQNGQSSPVLRTRHSKGPFTSRSGGAL